MVEVLERTQLIADLRLPDIEVPTFILQFLKHLKDKDRSYGTYVRYGYYLEEFLEWLTNVKKKEIDIYVWQSLIKDDYKEYYEVLIFKNGYNLDSLKRVSSVFMQLYLYLTNESGLHLVSPSLDTEIYELAKQINERVFISEEDFNRLIRVVQSKDGLTEHQLKGRDKLINRNVSILILFNKYGLTLQELVNLKMTDLKFVVNKQIEISSKKNKRRVIELDIEDKLLMLNYLKDIPEPVRPKWHRNNHPVFVAFDYQRLTYRWVYDDKDKIDNGHPKNLSSLAVQKMILQEAKRANLENKRISAQTLRNAAILRCLVNGATDKEVQDYFGLKSEITLRKYKQYIED